MLLGFLLEKPNSIQNQKNSGKPQFDMVDFRAVPLLFTAMFMLAAKGYLDGEVVGEGEMPEKTIYTLNEKGRQYFQKLM